MKEHVEKCRTKDAKKKEYKAPKLVKYDEIKKIRGY